jgi:hypothetical protein
MGSPGIFSRNQHALQGILASIDILMDNSFTLKKKCDISNFHDGIKTSSERLNRTMRNIVLLRK